MFKNLKAFEDFRAQRELAEINSNLRAMTENQLANQTHIRLLQSRMEATETFNSKSLSDFHVMQQQVANTPSKATINNHHQGGGQMSGAEIAANLQKVLQPISNRYARLAFEVHPDAENLSHRYSDMSLREWNKLMIPRIGDARERMYGSYSERLGYAREAGLERFARDYESARLTKHTSDARHGKPGIVPTISIDDVSSADPTPPSSITNSVRSSIYPKSRRVNFLCASLHFIQDLDILGLTDALDQVRRQMKQLCQNQRAS